MHDHHERRVAVPRRRTARDEPDGRALREAGELVADAHAAGRTESVALNAATRDGTCFIHARLQRNPGAGLAAVWVRVFANGRTAAYVRNDLPCESITIDAQQPASLYVQPGLGRWQRESRDGRIVRATAEVTVFGHETFDAPPETEGPIAIRINATFEAMGGTGTTRPGRLESIGGTVSGTLTLGADTIDLGRGLGHWHEQMQAETRWQDPFSYMSLWGEGLGIIGRQMWNEGGFVDRGGHMTRIVRVDQDASETLDLPEDVRSRRLTFHLEDGTTLPVVLETQYRHLRRVRGLKWQGDGVRGTVGGVPVVGFYNRFPVPRGAVIPRL